MPHPSQASEPRQTADEWWVNDQTPDNPYGKSEDYEAFLDYLGALPSSLTAEIAAGTLRVNLYELNDHPEYKAAAIGALEMWASVTPLKLEIVDDAPFDSTKDWVEVVSPEIGEEDDGRAYSSGRYVSIGQHFDDTEPNRTDIGGYVFQSFIHEFGHEFGLNHPGAYNYSGPGSEPITYMKDATWIYDREQYSVMSYFDGIDVGETSRWSASTPLMADIEAVIRRLFSTVDENGVRTYQHIDVNTGDNVYGFGGKQCGYQLTSSGMQHDVGFAIHDTGGTDTIDFSGSTAGTILDLRPGHFSSVNGHSNNVSIFAGHNADATDYYVENGIGSSYDDILIGNDGANILDGRGGADRMAGNGGDDIYFVDSLDDIVREEANGGNDTVVLMTRNLKIRQIPNVEHIIYADELNAEPASGGDCGGAGDDTLNGDGADKSNGDAGSDLLNGRRAAMLTGCCEGEDTLRFSRELEDRNVDRIADFKAIDDRILLDNLIFESVGGDGAFSLNAFYGSTAGDAHDADDRIIYDTDSGALSYDVDGHGEVATIQLAELSENLTLSSADVIGI
ncbi:M10 family metallopeptidase C-terminal domain-containing protein [Rhizobium etli]|uniref:M10 family metallopeptidase C-terminal domain-containing protein n=1 Tax=Rhizobium etli TaxID=29449 RepID=UPI00038399D2|nr:serralysin-like metalloprotease domain-containing protein [Rhizobium etli bv. mimosae str. Mim1]